MAISPSCLFMFILSQIAFLHYPSANYSATKKPEKEWGENKKAFPYVLFSINLI